MSSLTPEELRERPIVAAYNPRESSRKLSSSIKLRSLKITVTPLARLELLSKIESAVLAGGKHLILNHNLHSAYLYHSDPRFRRLYDSARTIIIDGFPVLVAARAHARLYRPDVASLSSAHRLGSTDWIPYLSSVKGLQKIAVVGARREVNDAFTEWLSQLLPGKVQILGLDGEDWSHAKTQKIYRKLIDFAPQLVLIGLGMPLQEHFLDSGRSALPDSVYATVGGAIDQLTGYQKPAPRSLGLFGLEWVWRLVSQPRRLGARYLVEPWKLAAILIRMSLRR